MKKLTSICMALAFVACGSSGSTSGASGSGSGSGSGGSSGSTSNSGGASGSTTSSGGSSGSTTSSGGVSGSTSSSGSTSGHSSTTSGTGSGSTTSSGSTSGHSSTSSGTGSGSTTSSGSTSGSTSGTMVGSPCTYSQTTFVDSCTAAGYECNAEFSQTATSGTCVLPQDNAVCVASVGCQDGGTSQPVCTPGFQSNGADVSLCEIPCTTSTTCSDPLDSCQNVSSTATADNVCFQTPCDLSDAGTFTFVGPFYNACNAAATNDGQCLSFNSGAQAICFQDGTAEPGAVCDFDRGGANPICTFGNFCTPSLTNMTDPAGAGACMPITDGGAGCTGFPLQIFGGSDWAVCTNVCDAGTPPSTCATGFTCIDVSGMGTGPWGCLPT